MIWVLGHRKRGLNFSFHYNAYVHDAVRLQGGGILTILQVHHGVQVYEKV
jgi:hypothetical protein